MLARSEMAGRVRDRGDARAEPHRVVRGAARDHSNPIWSLEGRREMVAVAETASVSLASLCMNETLVTPFDDPALAADLATRLPQVMSDLHVDMVVLPLLEASDLGVLDSSGAARSVRLLADHLHGNGARLTLELGVSAAESLRFSWRSPRPRWWGCATTSGTDRPWI